MFLIRRRYPRAFETHAPNIAHPIQHTNWQVGQQPSPLTIANQARQRVEA
jgi:hypothetical protein